MMLYKVKTALNYENFEEFGNAMCKQNTEFPDLKVGGIYS
jgi:hypothetical protein